MNSFVPLGMAQFHYYPTIACKAKNCPWRLRSATTRTILCCRFHTIVPFFVIVVLLMFCQSVEYVSRAIVQRSVAQLSRQAKVWQSVACISDFAVRNLSSQETLFSSLLTILYLLQHAAISSLAFCFVLYCQPNYPSLYWISSIYQFRQLHMVFCFYSSASHFAVLSFSTNTSLMRLRSLFAIFP